MSIFIYWFEWISLFQLKFSGSTSEDHQFVRGIPIYAISEVLDKIISGANGTPLLINGVKRPMPLLRILEVELYPTLLSKARSFGLSDAWIQVWWMFLYGLSFCFSSMCNIYFQRFGKILKMPLFYFILFFYNHPEDASNSHRECLLWNSRKY